MGSKIVLPVAFTDLTLPLLPDVDTGRTFTYDADTLTTVADGGLVDTWTNSQGIASVTSLTAATTRRPSKVLAPNGHRAVRFVAANGQRMLNPANFTPPLAAPFTYAFLFKPNTLPASATVRLLSGSAVTTEGVTAVEYGSAGQFRFGLGGAANVTSPNGLVVAGQWHAAVVTHGASGVTGPARIFLNRLTAVATATSSGNADLTLNQQPKHTVGSNGGSTAQYIDADLQAFIGWDRILPDDVISGVLRGLASRVGLTLGS